MRLPSRFSPAQAAAFTSAVWTRLGFSPTVKSTWTRERTNMPSHTSVRVSDFAPKAWGAICEILGGEDRVAPWSNMWNDSFIVNLGSPEWAGTSAKGKEKQLRGWHVDGDFFVISWTVRSRRCWLFRSLPTLTKMEAAQWWHQRGSAR